MVRPNDRGMIPASDQRDAVLLYKGIAQRIYGHQGFENYGCQQ